MHVKIYLINNLLEIYKFKLQSRNTESYIKYIISFNLEYYSLNIYFN